MEIGDSILDFDYFLDIPLTQPSRGKVLKICHGFGVRVMDLPKEYNGPHTVVIPQSSIKIGDNNALFC